MAEKDGLFYFEWYHPGERKVIFKSPNYPSSVRAVFKGLGGNRSVQMLVGQDLVGGPGKRALAQISLDNELFAS